MKISDLKPCASCGGPLRSGMNAAWYVVRVTQAMLNPRAANEVLGMLQFFQGKSLGMAEAFAPRSDDAVLIMGDKEPSLMTELHLCFDCMYKADGSLGFLLERIRGREESKSAGQAGDLE